MVDRPRNPALGVLADLLLAAVEADRVDDTYDLLSELVGERSVRTVHGIAMERLSDAVAAAAGAPLPGAEPAGREAGSGPSGDVFDLTRRLRASMPGGRP